VTEKDLITRALLFCADPPSERHKRQIIDFLKDKYQSDIPLVWVEDKSIKNGFRLEV
jgi:F0F1-type ATP synthase delta subunit